MKRIKKDEEIIYRKDFTKQTITNSKVNGIKSEKYLATFPWSFLAEDD